MVTSKVQVWNKALSKIGETDQVESETEDRPAARACDLHWDDVVKEVLEARHWPFATRQRKVTQINDQAITYTSTGVETAFDIPYPFLETTQLEVVHIAVGGAETTLDIVDDYTLTLGVEGQSAYVTPVVALTSGQKLRITVSTSRVGWEFLYALPADFVTDIGFLYTDGRHSLVLPQSRPEYAIVANDAGEGQILCCDLDEDDFAAFEYIALIDHVPAWPKHFLEAVVWRLAHELALALKKDTALGERAWLAYNAALDRASAYAQNMGHEIAEPDSPSIAARGG